MSKAEEKAANIKNIVSKMSFGCNKEEKFFFLKISLRRNCAKSRAEIACKQKILVWKKKPFHVQFSLGWRKNFRENQYQLSALGCVGAEKSHLWWFGGMENMLGSENKQRCGWIIASTLLLMLSILRTWIISFILFDSGASIVLRLVLVRQTGANLRAETRESLAIHHRSRCFSNADRIGPMKTFKVGLSRLPSCDVVNFHTSCCIKNHFSFFNG